jgi:hypothetical protein
MKQAMSVRIQTNERRARLVRDLLDIGLPATQAATFAKKFLRLAVRPGKVYKKTKKATRVVRTTRRSSPLSRSLLGSRMMRIEGTAPNQLAIKRAEGEYVIEPSRAQPTRKSANHRMQARLSHK